MEADRGRPSLARATKVKRAILNLHKDLYAQSDQDTSANVCEEEVERERFSLYVDSYPPQSTA